MSDHINAAATRMDLFAQTEHALHVTWDTNEVSVFDWFWIKDHGEDETSLEPGTLQRNTDTFGIPSDIRPAALHFDAATGLFRIDWADNSPPTEISVQLLARMAGLMAGEADLTPGKAQILWQAGTLPDPLPSVDFSAIVETDAGLLEWQRNIHIHGFCVVTGCTPSEDGTRALASRIAPAQNTIFGDYWKLSAEVSDHGDSAYTTQFLEPHTDSTYYHDAPGLQMFNCLEFDGKGGESTLVDGFAIAEAMRVECPEHFDTLTSVVVPGRYIEPGVHLRAERPAFQLDLGGKLKQISFNNYDRAPFILPEDEMSAFYAAYGEFHKRAMDQSNWVKIPLRPGMALIFDNWRCLHGRMGYVGKRVFYGCYHSRADFESRLRTLKAA